MDKIVYYPGCIAESAGRHVHAAAMRVFQALDIPFDVLPELTCCGSVNIRDKSPLTHLALNARNFALVQRQGASLVTICSTCLYSMASVDAALTAEPETRRQVNDFLTPFGLKYEGGVALTHVVRLLHDDLGLTRLRTRVKKKVNLAIAPFHGCHTLRPAALHPNAGRDDLEAFERLIEALGGRIADFGMKTECCGVHLLATNPEETHHMVGACTNDAAARGADVLVTASTLCQLALDACQGKSRAFAHQHLPVLHIVQLVGLALGLTPTAMGLDKHFVKPDRALRKLYGKAMAPAIAKRFDLVEPDDREPEVPLPSTPPRPSTLIQIRGTRPASP